MRVAKINKGVSKIAFRVYINWETENMEFF